MARLSVTAALKSARLAGWVAFYIAIRPTPAIIAEADAIHTYTVISAIIKTCKSSTNRVLLRTLKDNSIYARSLSVLANYILSINSHYNIIIDAFNYLAGWFTIVLDTTAACTNYSAISIYSQKGTIISIPIFTTQT